MTDPTPARLLGLIGRQPHQAAPPHQHHILEIDPDRQVRTRKCDCCGGERESVTGFVSRDGKPYAVYFAACYPHTAEAWIDVILGAEWDDKYPADHVTFGCRVGPVEGSPQPGCTVVQAASAFDNPSAIFGDCLDRERALVHPWLDDFWAVVFHILEEDPTVHTHLYGA